MPAITGQLCHITTAELLVSCFFQLISVASSGKVFGGAAEL